MKTLLLFGTIVLSIGAFGQVPYYVSTDSLVGWWPFDGNADEAYLNVNNGTVIGATLTTDRFGSPSSAYLFNGINNKIELNPINSTDYVTVSCWVLNQRNPGDGEWKGIVTTQPDNTKGFLLQDNTGMIYQWAVSNGGGYSYLYNTSPITGDDWMHLVAVIEPGSMHIYVNGILENTIAIGSYVLESDADLNFGSRYASEYYKGKLDDIGIWNRVLTACEINQLYTASLLGDVVATADDTEVCEGDMVALTGGGATTYSWDGDVIDDTPFSPPHGATTYIVIGVDDVGCIDTASIDILVNELPEITASADDSEVCEGDMVTLTGDGAVTYTWDGGAIDGTPYAPPLGTTTYTVIGTDDNGCQNTASIDILVNELPEITASADDSEVCEGDMVTLTGDGAVTYTWDGGAIDGTPYAPPLGTTTYTVIGTDDNGCQNTASIDIIVYEAITIAYVTEDEIVGDDGSIDITVTGGLPAYNFDWDNDGTGDFDDDEDLNDLPGGTYIVVIEDEAGCSRTEIIVVSTQLGIAELNLNGATVFPNPTSDNLTIQLDGEFIYSLVSINGKILSTMKVTNQARLNLSELPDGVYFVEIQYENGSERVKLVKQ
ncbi:T9SS type A sorting domain-containing protein [Crocinitomix sp.]|nr:T9SS type A sorting domain-containing protein [Crocinitomix sp.]